MPDQPINSRLHPTAAKLVAVGYGIVCHCAFVIGVGAMIVAMFFGMSRSFGTLEPHLAFIANALLLAQFPLLHSWLLSAPGKRLLKRLAPSGIGSALASATYAAQSRESDEIAISLRVRSVIAVKTQIRRNDALASMFALILNASLLRLGQLKT